MGIFGKDSKCIPRMIFIVTAACVHIAHYDG